MAKTYEELLDMVVEASLPDEDDLMEEGANTDLKGIKQDAKSLKKINVKALKRMYKAGDYTGAKAEGEKILETIEDYEKRFREVDQSFGSAVLGDLKGGALRLIKDVAMGIITLGIGPAVSFCKRLLSRCIQMQKMAGKKDLDYKMFNSYANDILTMLDDMKHQVKKVIVECDKGMSNTGEATQESVDTAYAEYLQNEMDEMMTEAVLTNPIKKHLERLKDIKKRKPNEYDGPEELKKFVDANYDDIEKATEILEKEPDEIRKGQLFSAVASVCSFIGLYAGAGLCAVSMIGGGIFFGLSLAIFLASGLVAPLLNYAKASSDRKAMDELSKIRDALAKVKSKQGDRLPTPLRNKITDLITKIDDAETEMNSRIKEVKESGEDSDDNLDDKLAIYEAAYAGEISEEDRKELLQAYGE